MLDDPPVLDIPPEPWTGTWRALRCVQVQPVESEDVGICFERDETTLLISGRPNELARIVAHAVAQVAEGPATKNGVGSHVHLDPTSDPERRIYATDSGSIVVGFDPSV